MAEENKAENEEAENPEAEGEEGEEGSAKKKGGLMKMLLFIGLPAVILLGGGGAAALFLLGGSDEPEVHADASHGDDHGEGGHDEEHAKADHGEKGKGGEAKHAVLLQLPEILVNIQSSDGTPTLLKLKLTLELQSEEDKAAIEAVMPRVWDRFNAFLRELRVDDLAGSAGSHRLRVELLRRVNLAVAPKQVNGVLIESMLVH